MVSKGSFVVIIMCCSSALLFDVVTAMHVKPTARRERATDAQSDIGQTLDVSSRSGTDAGIDLPLRRQKRGIISIILAAIGVTIGATSTGMAIAAYAKPKAAPKTHTIMFRNMMRYTSMSISCPGRRDCRQVAPQEACNVDVQVTFADLPIRCTISAQSKSAVTIDALGGSSPAWSSIDWNVHHDEIRYAQTVHDGLQETVRKVRW